MSVRPSVRLCAKVMYTKTQEQVKISSAFFYLKGVYWESKLSKFRPERTKAYEARAEWNFHDFAISREPFDEIYSNFFCFKDME